ncbi:MAG: cardiolipin synthase B [bacterium]|nr:MAG: cardiolipin synthase B [bacterium]
METVKYNTFDRIKNQLPPHHFIKKMRSLGVGGLSGGNNITLLGDGYDCFNEFYKAIEKAKYSINLETYIFNSDETGWYIANALSKKAKVGLEVNVIYDALGCLSTSPEMFNTMKEAGVELIEYHPFMPWRKYWNVSFRDHRKILTVDGQIAFIGGMNIGDEYSGSQNGETWRDTQIKVEGPAVRDIQFFFLENWYRYGGAILDNQKHFPNIEEAGKNIVMVLCSRSRKKVKPIRQSYIEAIRFAKQKIYISNAYFIPDARIYREFIKAAKRGVDVRFIVPGKSDVSIVKYAGQYLYKKYLKNNIRLYEYNKTILHSKTGVIDEIWSTVGSSNLDRRSFNKNLEVNAVILNQDFGSQMEQMFFDDLKHSTEVHLDNWQKRPLLTYLLEWLCYRFRNYL